MSQRITGKLNTECTACHGTGHTPAGEPVMEFAWHPDHGQVEVRTLQQGSGCLKCGGAGQLTGKGGTTRMDVHSPTSRTIYGRVL